MRTCCLLCSWRCAVTWLGPQHIPATEYDPIVCWLPVGPNSTKLQIKDSETLGRKDYAIHAVTLYIVSKCVSHCLSADLGLKARNYVLLECMRVSEGRSPGFAMKFSLQITNSDNDCMRCEQTSESSACTAVSVKRQLSPHKRLGLKLHPAWTCNAPLHVAEGHEFSLQNVTYGTGTAVFAERNESLLWRDVQCCMHAAERNEFLLRCDMQRSCMLLDVMRLHCSARCSAGAAMSTAGHNQDHHRGDFSTNVMSSYCGVTSSAGAAVFAEWDESLLWCDMQCRCSSLAQLDTTRIT